MRLAPGQDDLEAFALLRDHMVAHTPWGARVEVTLDDRGLGFSADAQGPVYDQARAKWGNDVDTFLADAEAVRKAVPAK